MTLAVAIRTGACIGSLLGFCGVGLIDGTRSNMVKYTLIGLLAVTLWEHLHFM